MSTPLARPAAVYRRKKSLYYSAVFQVWDARAQRWKQAMKSTRCTDESKALQIAREFERVSLAAGGVSGEARISRDFVVEIINDILRIAGHREVVDSKSWKSYSDAWLKAAAKRVPKTLSASSLKAYTSYVNNFTVWLGKDAELALGNFTGDMLQNWYLSGIEEGLKPTTMNIAASTISTIFERARDEGYATRNPVNLISRELNNSNTRDPYTPAEVERLLSYLRASTERRDWLTVTLLGLCTSQRLTDCANALRTQIVVQPGTWIWEMQQGKTKKKMRIPIVGPLASHLTELWQEPTDSLYLAPSLAGVAAARNRGLSTQFTEILKSAGIEGRKVEGQGRGLSFNSLTFHSLRHTCNSLLANAGITPEVRRMITGHSNDATNLIYTHLEDATKSKALNKAFSPKKKAAARKAAAGD